MPTRGLMLVLSSPSGAGKSTLARALLQEDANIVPSVSCTTRERRPSETDGVHYHFVSQEAFRRQREEGGFLEWAKVHGNYYATPRAAVEQALASGRDIVFDIDWQGTLQLYETCRDDICSIFILPPSAQELHARLTRRAEDSAETIRKRLANAREEIRRWEAYDHVLVNTEFEKTFASLKDIVAQARAQRQGRAVAQSHAASLLDGIDNLVGELDNGLAEISEAVNLTKGP